MLLKTEQKGYKPFSYPWAFDAWKAQQKMHWLPEEVQLNEDVIDYKERLTDDERAVVTDVLRFFTQGDVDVGNCYIDKYLTMFKPVEVRMMLTAFSNMETIHMQAYSHLLDTLGLPESEYNKFMDIDCMRKKHENDIKIHDATELLQALAIYGGFVEGLQLFGSFAILMNFQRFGLLKGVGQIVTWSVRDETLHSESIIKLFHALAKESDINIRWLEVVIKRKAQLALNLEKDFLMYVFREGRKIRGIDFNSIYNYLKHLYHMRMDMLGFKRDEEVENGMCLQYMQDLLHSVEFANFFTSKSTEYTRANLTGEWEY